MTNLLPYKVYKAKKQQKDTWSGPSMVTILNCSRGVKSFAMHLATESALENLYFYKTSDYWMKEFGSMSETARLAMANHVLETYLSDDSLLQVNISHRARNVLIEEITSQNLYQGMFVAAANEVYHLLETDSFSRFKVSDYFQAFMTDLEYEQPLSL